MKKKKDLEPRIIGAEPFFKIGSNPLTHLMQHSQQKENQKPEEQGELVAAVTQVMRDADMEFEKIGGSTRHYVRDLLLPMLEKAGLKIIKIR